MNETVIKKVIKIFLASSIDELKSERDELGRFVLGINNTNLERGIYCYLDLCENDDSAMSKSESKQADYDRFIENEADAVFVLFYKKAGEYTMRELRLAQKCFVAQNRPKVYVYFKDFDEDKLTPEVKIAYDTIVNEYQHFFGTFNSIASVEVDILRAMFDICGDMMLRVREENGTVYIGNRLLMEADKLDYIQNNKSIEKLKKKIARLKSGDTDYAESEGLYGEEIDDEIQKCEKRLADRYAKCFKALEDRYDSIASRVKADSELQAAYNASVQGDYEKVLAVLDRGKLSLEARLAVEENQLHQKKHAETTLRKYKLRIDALAQQRYEAMEQAANYTYEENEQAINEYYEYLERCEAMDYTPVDEEEKTYEEAIDFIRKLHLYEVDQSCFRLWTDYIGYLCWEAECLNFDKAFALVKELERIYDMHPDLCTEADRTRLSSVYASAKEYLNYLDECGGEE